MDVTDVSSNRVDVGRVQYLCGLLVMEGLPMIVAVAMVMSYRHTQLLLDQLLKTGASLGMWKNARLSLQSRQAVGATSTGKS